MARMKKQLQYANRRDVKSVVFIGEDEVKEQVVKIKDMASGEEQVVPIKTIVNHLKPRADQP